MEKLIDRVSKVLKTDASKLEEKVEKVSEELRASLKEIEELKSKIASFEVNSLFEQVQKSTE